MGEVKKISPDFLSVTESERSEPETGEESAMRFFSEEPAPPKTARPAAAPPPAKAPPGMIKTPVEPRSQPKMVGSPSPDPDARTDEQRQEYCQTLMEDLLRWSADACHT